MRGQLENQYEGVGQSEMKEKFGSVRMQAIQDEFASFAGDLMQLKAEVIARHFDPQTIVQLSNMKNSPDVDLIPQAVEMIKQPDMFKIRVSIKAEALALVDYAQLKAERSQYLEGLTMFLTASAPLIQQDPRAQPFLLELLKWGMAGFKGSNEIEGVLDKAIEVMQKPEEQEKKPDPEETKAKAAMEMEQMKAQMRMQEIQAKAQSDMQVRESDMKADIQTRQMEMQFETQIEQMKAELEMKMLAAKMQADTQTEMITSKINAEQHREGVEAELQKEILKQKGEIERLRMTKRADAGIKVIEKRADESIKREELAEKRYEADKPSDS